MARSKAAKSLVAAAEEPGGQWLVELYRHYLSKGESHELSAVAQQVSNKDRVKLCTSLLDQLKDATSCLDGSGVQRDEVPERPDEEEEEGADEGDESHNATQEQGPRTDNGKEEARVRAVVACARGLHDSCRRGQPEDVLRNLAKEVHDRVLLSAWASKEVQADAVALCEHWWSKHKPGGDALASKTVLFLLAHSLESGKRTDVKRVYAMREAIQRFDFEDESIGSLQGLLLRCIFSPHYLHCNQGRRFLSFLFSLHSSFVPQLFATMKNQIPSGKKGLLDAYADILFRAWRQCAGPCLAEVERVLGELAKASLQAPTAAMAANIRSVMEGFYSKKNYNGVDGLLSRLYGPIIYRCLTSANAAVRRNAVLTLKRAFPIYDPTAPASASEALISKQCSELERLLVDECPAVRAAAASTAAEVLDRFWEALPSNSAASIISTLSDKLARDSASSAVRAAAIKSLNTLVRNPMAQNVLRKSLPKLCHSLGDKALTVRIAMADLLLTVCGIKAIRFDDIVSLEAIHVAIAVDKPPVVSRLTRLLVPSYLPLMEDPSEPADRLLMLLRRWPKAIIPFCRYATSVGAEPTNVLNVTVALAMRLSELLACSQPDGTTNASRQGGKSSKNEKSVRTLSDREKEEGLANGEVWEYGALAVAELFGSLQIKNDDEDGVMEEVADVLVRMLENAHTVKGRSAALRAIRSVLHETSLQERVSSECSSRLESLDKAPSSEEECNEIKECLLTICTSSESSARSYLEEVLRRLQEGNSPSTQARKKMKGSTTPKRPEGTLCREVAAKMIEILLDCEEGREILSRYQLFEDAVDALRQYGEHCILSDGSMRSGQLVLLAYGKGALHLAVNEKLRACNEAVGTVISWAEAMLRQSREQEGGESHQGKSQSKRGRKNRARPNRVGELPVSPGEAASGASAIALQAFSMGFIDGKVVGDLVERIVLPEMRQKTGGKEEEPGREKLRAYAFRLLNDAQIESSLSARLQEVIP